MMKEIEEEDDERNRGEIARKRRANLEYLKNS